MKGIERLYHWLLKLYPVAFRQDYGDEMQQVFVDCCRATHQSNGWRGVAVFGVSVLWDTLTNAFAEHRIRLINQFKKENPMLRRLIDIVVGLFLLWLLMPVLVLIGLLVILDSPGPALYKYRRRGLGGREFFLYKYRTMIANDNRLLNELALKGQKTLDSREKLVSPMMPSRDPRITRIGHFLRKTNLDELPILFSLLKGDVSLVGPRFNYHEVLQRKPGIFTK